MGASGGTGSSAAGKLPHWASNLEENVDKKLLVMLRDGRKIIGWLRTYDQFANLLLEQTVERHILYEEKEYADVYLGMVLIRGENVMLFGEEDPKLAETSTLTEKPIAYVLEREAAI